MRECCKQSSNVLISKGFLIMEVLVGLSLVLFVSMLIMQWHNTRIIEEKKNICQLKELIETMSLMHEIKAHKKPLFGEQKGTICTYTWKSCFSDECQCQIVFLVSTCAVSEKKIIFGVQ